MAGVGRPKKWSDERMATIVNALRNGSTRKAAYEGAGVGHSTFASWIETIPVFSEGVTRAEAECEREMSRCIKTAAKDDWRAAEAWLKRRRKSEWSEKIEQEHSGAVTLDAVLNALPTEFREAVRGELAGLVRSGSGPNGNRTGH